MKYFFLFLIILISLTSIQCTEKSKVKKLSEITNDNTLNENINPAKAFKEYITNYLNSYSKDKREKVSLLGGGWVNEKFEPESKYQIDVQKTNSLLTPFSGYCQFTLIRHLTAFHKNKNDAIKDTIFIKSDKSLHKHHYGFQENKWVVTSREHKSISSNFGDKWYDCNEVIQSGPDKGSTNIYGCWEN